MTKRQPVMPMWAYANTILLFFPILLGFGLFGMWFVPSSLMAPLALALLIGYYAVVIKICESTSGVKLSLTKQWKAEKNFREKAFTLGGFVMFGFLAYCGIYITCAAWTTSLFGDEARKNAEVISFSEDYTRRCRGYKIVLDGIAPPFKKDFCMRNFDLFEDMQKGEKVRLYGKQSVLGSRISSIERWDP